MMWGELQRTAPELTGTLQQWCLDGGHKYALHSCLEGQPSRNLRQVLRILEHYAVFGDHMDAADVLQYSWYVVGRNAERSLGGVDPDGDLLNSLYGLARGLIMLAVVGPLTGSCSFADRALDLYVRMISSLPEEDRVRLAEFPTLLELPYAVLADSFHKRWMVAAPGSKSADRPELASACCRRATDLTSWLRAVPNCPERILELDMRQQWNRALAHFLITQCTASTGVAWLSSLVSHHSCASGVFGALTAQAYLRLGRPAQALEIGISLFDRTAFFEGDPDGWDHPWLSVFFALTRHFERSASASSASLCDRSCAKLSQLDSCRDRCRLARDTAVQAMEAQRHDTNR